MIARLRSHLSYANLMATAAVFIALGGGAWALAKNSVGSREIDSGAVRSKELKNDDVRAADLEASSVGVSEIGDAAVTSAELAAGAVGAREIADGSVGGAEIAGGSVTGGHVASGSLAGDDVADDSLNADDVEESDFSMTGLEGAGLLAGQARNIGGDGDVTYGPIAGRNPASTSFDDVAVAVPDPTFFGNFVAIVSTPLAAGESRTFTLVHRTLPGGPLAESPIECTINQTQSRCSDKGLYGVGSLMVGVQIESTGAGLDPADTAYLGIAAETDGGAN